MSLFTKLKLFNSIEGHSQSSSVSPGPGRFWKPSQHWASASPFLRRST